MSFQLHKINAASFAANPALRDPNPITFTTLAAAQAYQLTLSGVNSSPSGDYWNSVIFDTLNPSEPTIPFNNDIDD